MKRVGIVGLGLMGGSLGLAMKRRHFPGQLRGYARRPETRQQALRLGAVDQVFDEPAAAVEDADLVVFCTPILTIPSLVSACRPALKPGCLLTDVGSTKSWLHHQIRPILRGTGSVFVGSHPIAGSEQQGIAAARPDLYEHAVVILTHDGEVSTSALDATRELWESVGARVRVMTPEEHDRIMARTSHLPHLTAAVLAATVGRGEDPGRWAIYCGSGFRDTTRIAEGSPEVWHDIVSSNAEEVASELRALRRELNQLSDLIEQNRFDSIRQFLEEARSRRRRLVRGKEPDEHADEPDA